MKRTAKDAQCWPARRNDSAIHPGNAATTWSRRVVIATPGISPAGTL